MDLSALPGAVFDDSGVLQHRGDLFGEQRRLAEGHAAVPLTDRTVIEVAGEDRLTWLDSITTQELGSLLPGESTELLVLDPQGRIEHQAAVFDDGVSAWLIADAADAEGLAAWLGRMVFRARVTVTVRDDLPVVGFVRGGTAEERLRATAQQSAGHALVWSDPWVGVAAGGHQYAVIPDHPGAQLNWALAILPVDSAWPDLEPAGVLAAEALRIAAWRPRWATEVDERSLPHETDWLRSAVHLAKGCYRGQETVAKVHNLGHPPRRLVLLHLDGSTEILPAPGDTVRADDREVGAVTSVARHYEDGPIALAIVGRRAPEGELTVQTAEGDVAAAQQIIVPVDAGATANVPRLTRLSRRR